MMRMKKQWPAQSALRIGLAKVLIVLYLLIVDIYLERGHPADLGAWYFSCILRWIDSQLSKYGANGKGACPMCMKPSRKSEARVLHQIRIAVHDETDIFELKRELQTAQQRSFELAKALEKSILGVNMCKREFTKRNIPHEVLDDINDPDTLESSLSDTMDQPAAIQSEIFDPISDIKPIGPEEILDTSSVAESEDSVALSEGPTIITLDEPSIILIDDSIDDINVQIDQEPDSRNSLESDTLDETLDTVANESEDVCQATTREPVSTSSDTHAMLFVGSSRDKAQ
ncbi:hypothetical protein CLU79DRAFT_856658 [Phycomyces nitens]|nr:hypothetical protein CLU79DRAFT_856658 [Phycomyces nitens]